LRVQPQQWGHHGVALQQRETYSHLVHKLTGLFSEQLVGDLWMHCEQEKTSRNVDYGAFDMPGIKGQGYRF
jgi:hypothetical protein